jgi:hypothetical protein
MAPSAASIIAVSPGEEKDQPKILGREMETKLTE